MLTSLFVGTLALHLGGTDAFTLRTASRTAHRHNSRHVHMAIEPADVKALAYYLSEVACVKPPAELGGLVGLLVSRGEEVFEPGSDAMQQLCETRDTIVSLDPAAVGKGSRRQQLVRLRNDIRATLKNVDEQLDTLQPSS